MMYNVNISAPNLMNVCVDEIREGGPVGYLYNKYSIEGIRFGSVFDLLQQMELVFEMSGYPQSTTQTRRFGATENSIQDKKKVEQMVKAEEVLEKSGELASFVIHVKYRQNSTWQGDIFWAEKQEKRYFRSALEMLKLIDNALDQTEEDDPETETEND